MGMRRHAFLLYGCMAAVILSGVPFTVWSNEPPAEQPPVGIPSEGWREWSMHLDTTRPPRSSGLNQAEFEEVLETIQDIGALFRRMPYLNPPPDAEISPSRNILDRVGTMTGRQGLGVVDTQLPEKHPLREWSGPGVSDGKGPVRAAFALGIYRPEYGRGNASCSVRVYINDPWLEGRFLYEDDEGGMFLPWPLLDEKDGRRTFEHKGTVLEKILPEGREPWIPVSQERWVRVLIAKTGEILEERRQQITASSEQRRQQIEQTYQAMKSFNPEQAEELKNTMEQNERVYQRIAEAIETEDYDALEAAGDRGAAMVGRARLALQSELAGMSAEERRAPAYGFEYDPVQFWMPRRTPARPSLLLEPDDPGAFPVVAPNPEFFRRDIPAGQIQSITIVNRLWDEFSEKMEQELDWGALRNMVQ
jgi:hypothetical protein